MNAKVRGQNLITAIIEGKEEDAIDLLKHDVDFKEEQRGDNAIHMAARKGNLKLIKMMKDRGANLEHRNVNGNVPLHYAAKGGYLDVVRYLHQRKVDMDIENTDGETPLHMAVIMQTMDVIEELVSLGMNPNKRNTKTGETPLHIALKFGRQEAMEGLLICKANPNLKNVDGRKPEDVAKSEEIRESIRMYRALLIAIQSGYIKAKGLQITRNWLTEPRMIDRVGIILEMCDIPMEFPANFYCRREKPENSSVKLKKFKDEQVVSDVFYIRISDVNKTCASNIYLPLYMAPSDKEEVVLRFINCDEKDRTISEYVTKNKVKYCLLETVLVPETTCTCAVYVRPKMEENAVSKGGKKVTSDIEPKFSMDIPASAFEEKTVLNLMVFETNDDGYISDETEDKDEAISSKPTSSKSQSEKDMVTGMETDNNKGADSSSTSRLTPHPALLSDIYQINITGEQPKKGVMMQIPMCKGKENIDDVAIISADETKLHLDNQLEVVTAQPKIVNCNLIFEASHFCIYVAVPKEKVATPDGVQVLQRQISSARDKRKPGTFIVVVKLIEGLLHNIIVDCGIASKTTDRLLKWTKKGYEKQRQGESEAILMSPGDIFFVDVTGNASLESQSESTLRKLCFSKCRTSIQPYNITLSENVKEDKDGHAVVIINKKVDNGIKEVARLPIKLHVPPPPAQASVIPKSNVEAKRYDISNVRKAPYSNVQGFYKTKK